MFVAVLSIAAQKWKEPKSPSTGEWMKTVVYMCNAILFSHKKNEVLVHATTRMSLENMLRERSQS